MAANAPHLEILLVEDNPTDVLLTEEALSAFARFRLKTSERLSEALKLLAESHFDIVLLDLGLPDSQGLETLRKLRATQSKVAIVVLTGKDDEELALRTLQEGAEDYLTKSEAGGEQLRRTIRYALERAQSAQRLRESERHFHELANSMPQIVWAARPDGQVEYYNDRWYEYTGTVRRAEGNESWLPFVHPKDADRLLTMQGQLIERMRPFQLECRLRNRAGEYRWHLIRSSPTKDEAGVIVRWIGTSTDIDDLKTAQEELLTRTVLAELTAEIGASFASGGNLPNILQRCTELLVTQLDAAFARIWVHNESEQMLELRASAGMYTHLDGAHGRIRIGEYKVGRIAKEKQAQLTNQVIGDSRFADQEWARREGMVAFAGYPLLVDNHVVGVMALFAQHPLAEISLQAMEAIADTVALGILRAQAEQNLRAREELLRSAFDYTNLATAITDLNYRLIRANGSFLQMFGYSDEEILKLSMEDITHPEDIEISYANREPLLAGSANAFQMEKRYVCKDGKVIWGRTNVSLVRNSNGEPVYYIGQVQNITEQKRAEDDLRLRDRAIQAVSQGIIISDPNQEDNPIIFASPGFERLTGYSAAEAMGRNCRFLQGKDTNQDSVAQLREAIHDGRECTVEILNYRKDGKTFWNSLAISPIRDDENTITHFVGVQTDVTEHRQLEEQLRQAQKMEAIGSLAGGVAHDFNNLLTIINGYSDIVMSQLPTDNPLRSLVRNIGEAGERAASLTRQLLAFSRKQVLEPKILNFNVIVDNTAKMLRRLIGEDVELTAVLDPDLATVKADPGQMEQVLINFAVNARDAMPQGGTVTIKTSNIELKEQSATEFVTDAPLLPGPYSMLSFTDTGCGMDEATSERIFEPFFTTKAPGQGTGLGLATVFAIVKQNNGYISVSSAPGQGTTFKVYLPVAIESPLVARQPSKPIASTLGDETILLVEDDPAVRAFAHLVLQKQGYVVLVAGRGEEALQIANDFQGTIHLLVTDVVMPSMSGRELVERLRAHRPSIKILYLSGYTDDAVLRHGVSQAETAFLQKPFKPTSLTRKVRSVLDQDTK